MRGTNNSDAQYRQAPVDILVVTHVRFWQRSGGSEQRVNELLAWLCKQSGVAVSVLLVHGVAPPDDLGERCGLKAVFSASTINPTGQKISNNLPIVKSGIRSSLCLSIRYAVLKAWKRFIQESAKHRERKTRKCGHRALHHFCDIRDAQLFSDVVRSHQPKIILFEYIRTAYLHHFIPRHILPHLTLWLDTHDVINRREKMFADNASTHLVHVTEQEELGIADKMDVVIGIQPFESDYFRERLKRARVITVMHSHPITATCTSKQRPLTVLFVGKSNPPNARGIKQFIVRGWPLVLEKIEESIELRCVGTICDSLKSFPLPQGVTLAGFVDCLDDEYRNATLVIAPLYFGGGLKIKVVEALCHGKALVTTPCGAQGLEDGQNLAFLVAADSEQMAEQCVILLRDEEQRKLLEKNAIEFAQSHFSESACFSELKECLREYLS